LKVSVIGSACAFPIWSGVPGAMLSSSVRDSAANPVSWRRISETLGSSGSARSAAFAEPSVFWRFAAAINCSSPMNSE